MHTYLVGGAVRDELLGLEVKDRDWVVVGATPDQMLAEGFKQVGADFPVFLHPGSREEYALARTERKQGHGYHGFEIYSAPDVTLEEDLKRRDLTINAMARDNQGHIIDPFNGQQDIRDRQLRHVSEAFAEDPLRILRIARFAARFAPMGFEVCQNTMELMQTMVNDGEVHHLVAERVWQEIQRALQEKEPGTFFEVLRACGALDVLIPELSPPERFDAAMAALHCVHRHDGNLTQRFAALMSPVPPQEMSERARALKAPNDCTALAQLLATTQPILGESTGTAPGASELLDLLDRADVWRRADRFHTLLEVLRCTLPEMAITNLDALQRAATAAAGVEPRQLLDKGFKGKALGQAIQQERLKCVEQALTGKNR
ncbi:multifunctional CCA tRNA nucleotidyl transferase/2'3'-cyclic phosphodiesterase/2'nucleotidase/phosphatase [Marinobacter sp. F4216]|uniref:multifunctional CCA tRNA nucleotidyl transferase/2'3'-cyclic phosphodiesterase/2'nucleotidase/phosphatase n=1 Tax=Marinobacter sp. F4216 TaxID=2874281 RepID=UPI001CBBFF41|nr:multifunctional CCA tRNA nucleotidyl transferase/2'3'-cyclic phosphodiesterase/2'nucleotidase/phosphatase [Marinobacter sp. F4216]MBZ2168887.1 multifunctional CCA tRNA nucleotidyl transferase/2'3'-cyclic phosphodiesterase/2'nucleotidase/phosphatase [Marinobacter sp. F4216]